MDLSKSALAWVGKIHGAFNLHREREPIGIMLVVAQHPEGQSTKVAFASNVQQGGAEMLASALVLLAGKNAVQIVQQAINDTEVKAPS
jgi:hypothetical protein